MVEWGPPIAFVGPVENAVGGVIRRKMVYMKVECYKCGKSPADGFNLYRQNEKGQPAVWACAAHSKPIDDKLVHIMAQLQKRGNRQ